GGSGFRYSFDFNNDGDFLDAGEGQDGTSPSARFTFTTRGWHVVRGRIRSADGRFTDYWVRVFVPWTPESRRGASSAWIAGSTISPNHSAFYLIGCQSSPSAV